jgi:N4-gp56 family major capsid protein
MANTTRTQITEEVGNFYDRVLLEKAVPAFVHNRFAQVRDLPRNAGTMDIRFRRYGLLTAQTTALSEGVTPSGKQLSITDVNATVQQYGDYVTLTDVVLFDTIDPILTETADILGEQVGDTLDQLARDVMAATTTKQYASSATQTSDITAAMKITRAEVKEAVRTLRSNNAKPITSMINPSTGYNTTPIGRSFVGIVSENTAYDLDDAEGWVPVEKYPNKSDVMPDEIGALGNVRFIMTTNAKIRTGEGNGGADVHSTLIMGMHAVAQTRISGEALKNIVKPLGSGGTNDPLDQRATSGWKITYVATILNDAYILDLQHGVTA